MALRAPRAAVRARQRSRTSLRAFANPLVPVFEETGIDQLRVYLKGHFRSSSRDLSAAVYLDGLSTYDTDNTWFLIGSARPGERWLNTRAHPDATLGLSLVARAHGPRDVDMSFKFRCNPTRTLAHLMMTVPDNADAGSAMIAMTPIDFFRARENVPRSLDGETNWVHDPDAARRMFGTDLFSAFLPIYVFQLRQLALRIASFNADWSEDAGDDLLSSNDGVLRLQWGRVTAPQAEAYFERYHGGAQSVVRSAAQNVLNKLDRASVRHHWPNTSFERAVDLFSMNCVLPGNQRSLSMYAKATDRLRFEVRRKGAGAYRDATQPGPSGRLLAMLSSERRNLLEACSWRVVGELFAEHGVPVPNDLLMLISAVEASCRGTDHDFRKVIRSLLVDGGISVTEGNRVLIASLREIGVISRTTLRRRDNSRLPRRYALAEPYLSAQRAVMDALSDSDQPDETRET